jgi:hypothetical protein
VRFLSFLLQLVLHPLSSNPRSQLCPVCPRNIAVPIDFAIVGKLAQTVFPGGAEVIPFKANFSNFWIRKVVM